MTPGVIRSFMRQGAPHPFHMGIHHPTQFSSPQLDPAICRSQNAASQNVIKLKMAPRGKLKAENGRYKYPVFFYSRVFYSNLIEKNWILTLMLTVERGFPKQPAHVNREVSLCSQCFSSPLPFKRMLPR